MGFLVYKVLNILVPLGPHLWLVPSLEMALLPSTQFNSCCWLLLTCPWFAMSKWQGSTSHPPVLVWEQATFCPLGSPQLHPFSFYIFQSSLEPPNDDIFLWSENVSDGSPKRLIMVCVKVAFRKKAPPATDCRTSNRVKASRQAKTQNLHPESSQGKDTSQKSERGDMTDRGLMQLSPSQNTSDCSDSSLRACGICIQTPDNIIEL